MYAFKFISTTYAYVATIGRGYSVGYLYTSSNGYTIKLHSYQGAKLYIICRTSTGPPTPCPCRCSPWHASTPTSRCRSTRRPRCCCYSVQRENKRSTIATQRYASHFPRPLPRIEYTRFGTRSSHGYNITAKCIGKRRTRSASPRNPDICGAVAEHVSHDEVKHVARAERR